MQFHMKNDLAYKNAMIATWNMIFGKTAPHATKQPILRQPHFSPSYSFMFAVIFPRIVLYLCDTPLRAKA